MGQDGSGLRGGQDEGSKVEMVWACEEEIGRYLSKEVREVGYIGYDEK